MEFTLLPYLLHTCLPNSNSLYHNSDGPDKLCDGSDTEETVAAVGSPCLMNEEVKVSAGEDQTFLGFSGTCILKFILRGRTLMQFP